MYKTINLVSIIEIKQVHLLKTFSVFKKILHCFLHTLLIISTAGFKQIPASVGHWLQSKGDEYTDDDGDNCYNFRGTYHVSGGWCDYLCMLFSSPTWGGRRMLCFFQKACIWWDHLPLSSLVFNKHDIVIVFSTSHLQSTWQILAN